MQTIHQDYPRRKVYCDRTNCRFNKIRPNPTQHTTKGFCDRASLFVSLNEFGTCKSFREKTEEQVFEHMKTDELVLDVLLQITSNIDKIPISVDNALEKRLRKIRNFDRRNRGKAFR